MNYQEMETLFRQEQLDLNHRVRLQQQALDPDLFRSGWKPVKEVNNVHKAGAAMAYVYGTMALILAWVQWESLYASIPLLLGAMAMFANGWFLPAQSIPENNLERFSTAELCAKIVDFRRYAMKRIVFDCAAVSFFVITMLIGVQAFFYGTNVFTHPEQVGFTYWLIGAGVILFSVIGGGSMNKKSLKQLQDIENQLEGYGMDDYV
jgi:hypothetical protein